LAWYTPGLRLCDGGEHVGYGHWSMIELLAECQNDYAELYASVSGDLGQVSADDTTDLSWWWNYQLSKYVTTDINSIAQSNGFFVVQYGDVYVNTCVQHQENWADPCDTSIGVCAGGTNFGFSNQQATELNAALAMSNFVHPDCPYGCQALDDDYLAEVSRVATSVETSLLQGLCTQNDKVYVAAQPLSLIDTCVGYSTNSDDLCPLSDYTFCSDVNEDTGSIVYGNSTMVGYSLQVALGTATYRHPQCL